MPLTWDVSKVKNHDELTTVIATADIPEEGIKAGDRRWNPVTTALVWHTMSVKMGSITEANAAEFYARVAAVEQMFGASLRAPREDGPGFEDRPITPRDVIEHIGLSCNVANESRAKFYKAQVDYFMRDKLEACLREAKALQEAAV